jgi:ribonuclease E
MADTSTLAAKAALPSDADIARAESFTHEPYVYPGEEREISLAPGTPRRRALDQALSELDAGLTAPSPAWRRDFSLLLGLERVLSEDEPRLADKTLLSAHQVDALSGTLTALLAEALARNGNGHTNGAVKRDVLADAAILGTDDDDAVGDGGAGAEATADANEPEEEFEEDEEPIGDDDDEDDDEFTRAPADEELEDEFEPDDVTAELEAELDRAEAEAALAGWDEEEDAEGPQDDEQLAEQPEDPNAAKRFWFEHATGAGKTVAALGFVEASRTGGVLILTHRRNLVDQFNGELRDRGYKKRITPPLLAGEDRANGPVTVETYQWFVRNAGNISSAYSIVICDEAHTALGEKTSAAIRAWTGPVFIGMTATGALIARHVTDLFPTQTSRFDLAQAARRGVIAPLRCVRIPPGPGVRTIAKVPLRRGEVDTEFDQEMLAELLDQTPFNVAVANLYKTRFNGVPGVVYAAGVRHAYNLAEAFRAEGLKAQAVSGETPKRELASILARYERGDIDVLINAQLLAEGWNSPRATVCIHLAPTASKRIYQQRVGRVTRRHPGKEAGLVVDFVHPATKHDDPVVTLHSLLDRDVYRGGAIVVGPVRRGRGRRVRVERRVLPVCAEPERRAEVFERELWRIAVEHLDYGEQHVWAALAGARVQASGWRRARAMLHFDRDGELRRRFLITAVQRNKNPQLRLKALAEIAASRDPDAFDTAIDIIGTWVREERREGAKIMLQAMVDKRIGRRDQANAWIWRIAEYTRDVHEEYAVQRWPETKRLLGLLVNSSGAAHARNARRLVHASRKQDRRLAAALLAAALAHTPEAEEVLRAARTRMARKPPALARELARNFPKRRGRGKRRRSRRGAGGAAAEGADQALNGATPNGRAAAASHRLLANGSDEGGTVDRPPTDEPALG